MRLKRLEADRLRNLRAVDLALPAQLTFLCGRNAQGKTGLLEAIYLLATGRSFRTRRLDEAVCRDGGPLRVAGAVQSRRGESRLAVVIDVGVRKLLLEHGEVDFESWLGRLNLVELTAGRMQVLKGAPDERRRFIDRGVVGLRPGALRELGEYRRVVGQRNALLRQAGGRASGTVLRQLAAWDERLIAAAAAVHRRRREYAVRLAARMGEAGRVLFTGGEEVRVRYRPSPAEAGGEDPSRFEEVLAKALERGRPRDLGLGFTGAGPHRDEVAVELNGQDLRRYGSAGQLRAAMIALKLAKLSLLREEHGESPLFLMDDFDSDLDEVRAEKLVGFLQGGDFQAVVASSKETLTARFRVPFAKVVMDAGTAKVG